MPNPKPLTDEVLEAAEFAGDRAEDAISEQLLNEKKVGGLPSPIHAATEAAAPYIARAERERIARFLTSDSTCDSILTELAARAGGEIHLARGHAALARWDLKAELKAALTALEPEGSNE